MTNKAKEMIGAVGTFFSVAGGFGTFATAPSLYAQRYGISNDVFVRLSELALVCGGVATLAAIANLVQRSKQREPSTNPRLRPLPRFHERRAARISELGLFREMLVDKFGESEVPSLEVLRRWHLRNSEIFQLIFEVSPTTGISKLIGCFKAVPMTDNSIPEIELEMFKGTNIPDRFIVERGGDVAAFWIGDLVSVSKRNAMFVMAELRRFMLENLKPGMRLFGRALTEDGLDLLIGFKFVTVVGYKRPQIGKICGLYPEDYAELLQRLQAGKSSRVRLKARKAAVSSKADATLRSLETLAAAA